MSLFVPTANKGVAVGEDNHQRKEEEAIREQKRSLISLASWAPAESAEARQGRDGAGWQDRHVQRPREI